MIIKLDVDYAYKLMGLREAEVIQRFSGVAVGDC